MSIDMNNKDAIFEYAEKIKDIDISQSIKYYKLANLCYAK